MAISNNARVIFTKARNIYDVTGSLLAGMKVNHFEGQRGIVTESYTEPRLSPDVSVYDLTGGQYTADELPDGFTWYKVYTNSGEIIDVPETAIQPANANIVAVVEERLRKAQENKSFKDSEGRVSGSKKEKAAYRKILNVADLSGIELQGEALAVSLIKKDKVYPKIDIEGQKAFGASSGAVYLKTQLRSAFPNQPAISSPIMRRIYTGFAEYLYNYFANTTEVMNFIYMLQNLVDSNTLYIEFFVWHSDDQEWARKEATAYLSRYNDRLDDAEMRLNMKFDKWRHKHPEEQWIFNFKKTVSLPKTFEIDPDLAKEIQDAQENYKRILAEVPDFVNDFLSRNKLSSAYGKSGITRHLIKSYFEGRLYNFLYTRTDSVQGIFNEAFFTYQGMSEADSARLTAEKTKKDSETLAKSNVALEKAKQLVTVEQIDEFFTVNNKENDFVKVYLYRIVDVKRGKTEGEWQRYNDQPNRPEDIKRFFLKNYIRFLESDIKKLTEKIDANKKLYAPRADNWSWAEKSEGGAPVAPKADLVINKYPPLSFIKRVGGLKIDKEELENFETTKYYLQTVFGFKEFEYGQTISDKDAREIIYHFLGAMADLGEILNMDIKQLNQLGGLSMAFASRGSGSALAHYESVAKIINLTKSRGDGAVAHEYFHYLDNIVPSINNPAYSFKMWLSDIYKETSRGYYWDTSTVKNSRVNYAMQRILEFIYFCKLPQQVMEQVGLDLNQDGGYTELLTIKASDVSISKSYFGSTIEETFKNFITRHPQYKQLDRLKPKDISVLGALPKHFGLEEYAFTFTRKQSKFYSNSSKMKSDYWTRPWELLARSWETYIYDKLERAGRFNNYLVSGTYFDRSEGVYPYGKEREALFILFENLMTEFKAAYSVGDFVPFTSERVDEFIELEDSKPEKGQSKAEQKPHPIVAKFEKLIELLQNKLEDVPVDEKTDKTEVEPVNNNVTIPDSMKKAARMDAIGYIAGGSVQYVESRGYEFIPCKPGEKNDGYYDLVGLVGGAKAERCIEKGVTVQRTAKAETGISPSSGNSTAFEVVEDTPSENLIEAKYIGASAPVNEALAKGSFTVIVPKSVVAVKDIEIGKNVLFVGTTGSFAKFIKAFNETGKKHDDYKIMQVVDATGTKPFAYEYDFDSKDFWRSGTAYRKGGQIKFASGGPINQLNDRIDLLNEMLQESPDNAALSDRIELLYEMILEAEKLDGKGDPKKAWMYPVKNAEQKAHGLPVEEFTPEYLKPGKFYIAKGKEDRYYLFHESTGTTIPSVPGIYRTRIIDFPARMGGKKVGIIFTPDRASKKREGFGSVSELKKFYNKGLTDDVESANAIKEFLSNEHVLLKEVGANIHQVEKALKDGEIQKAIDDARITYAEAYEIIQSAGLDVPLSISEKTPLEDKALARVQWKANKEGGQKYGNQEIHLLIDEAIFNKYIKPKLAADAPKTFKAYEKKYGMMYASFYRKEKQGEWQWGSMGDSLTDLEPHQDYYFNGWAIDVSSFDDPEAIAQGSTFDSDMPATWNKEPEVEPTPAEPMVVEDEKKPVRFEAGRRLNDKEKREVLRSLHDSYKVMNRPYTIETAVSESGRDYEKKVYLENATDYMIKSDITGRLLRWYIYLPDGKIAHPTELYPSISMTDAKRVQSNMEYYESLNDTAYKAVVDNLRKHNQIQAVIKLIEGAIEAGATFEKQYDSSDIGLKYPHTYLRWKGQEEPGDKYLHVRAVPEYVTLIHDKNYMGLTQKDYIDYKQGIRNKWFGYYGNIDWERFYNEFGTKKANGGKVACECSHTGGLADGLTLQDIAIKHNVSISDLRGQLKKGIVVEREHTDSDAVAAKIAMDHLVELPDYYTRLEKMEKEPQKMAKGAQVRVTNDATDGGVFHGPSHDNGGIKGVVKETGQPIEVEGGEGILNKRTMALDEEVTLSGTPCEIASELNQMGGGVKFDC